MTQLGFTTPTSRNFSFAFPAQLSTLPFTRPKAYQRDVQTDQLNSTCFVIIAFDQVRSIAVVLRSHHRYEHNEQPEYRVVPTIFWSTVPPESTASVFARPQIRFCAQICYLSRSPCHGSHGRPTRASHGIFVRDSANGVRPDPPVLPCQYRGWTPWSFHQTRS